MHTGIPFIRRNRVFKTELPSDGFLSGHKEKIKPLTLHLYCSPPPYRFGYLSKYGPGQNWASAPEKDYAVLSNSTVDCYVITPEMGNTHIR